MISIAHLIYILWPKSSTENRPNSRKIVIPTMATEDKEEAEKCIKIAKTAMASDQKEKAKRFLEKAQRIYVTPEAESLLAQLEYETPQSEGRNHATRLYHYDSTNLNANNNDDAERCIEVAQNALLKKDYDKAERFLLRAERFCPSRRSQDLLKQVEVAKASGADTSNGPRARKSGDGRKGSTTSARSGSAGGSGAAPGSQSNGRCAAASAPAHASEEMEVRRPRELTPDQIHAVQRVKAATDDYDILGLPKGTAWAGVRKSHKKLTLLLHPDKNNSEDSKEAFMIVNEAVERLKKKLKK